LAAKYIVHFLAQMHALGLTQDEVIACIRQKLSAGSIVGILGPNGCGKSTFSILS
jgi:ABC-type cobalamin/Fe3+-siderophores transport system ATPase subunit